MLIVGAPGHHLGTTIAMTSGDNARVAGGVAPATVMGSSRHLTGATAVLVGGKPVTRMSSVSLQNGSNCPGVRSSPSQTTVLIVAP